MTEIIEYKLKFTCKPYNKLLWFDNFICNEEWQIIRINDIKKIEKAYMDKNSNTYTEKNYDIALYRKNKWVTIKNNNGITIVPNKDDFKIPGLIIDKKEYIPILTIYKFDYDFHVLLTILQRCEKCVLVEKIKLAYVEAKIKFDKTDLTINGNVISYRGTNQQKFKCICNEINKMYKNEYKDIKSIMDLLDKPNIDPKFTHKSLAYRTWYNAKRENQREWPLISTIKTENSIEFPKNSGIYYYYPDKYVGLAERKDINSEKCIPKIYKTNHLNNTNSILYKYINNVPIENTVKFRNCLKKLKISKIKKLENEKYLEIDYNGKIIETYKKANVMVYMGLIIKYIEFEEKEEIKAQILNKENKRIIILNRDNEWVKSEGPRILNIPALPYNYRQIIHDYYILNRIKEGEIMDLTHIGIVNPEDDDIITFPKIDTLYTNKYLETHRLMTFKYTK
uniref:Uncharacterized protein n=1 Tax=Pichia etchellsii TaxID=28550 RepID=Q9HFH2_PICET|nr:hypothetical protein [Schwanniomyces etchellsii]